MPIWADSDPALGWVLDYLGDELEPSVLIGGWATVAMVGGEISKDIDLILGDASIQARLHTAVEKLSVSTHVGARKFRGEVQGVHIDIYVPHQSELGAALRLRVEVLARHTTHLPGQPWSLLTIEAHTISKMAALLDRADTEKGHKDAREILALLTKGVDAVQACSILAQATAGPVAGIGSHVASVFDLLPSRARANKAQRKDIAVWRRHWQRAADAEAAAHDWQRPTFNA